MDNLIILARALAAFDRETYCGWLMAEAEYQRRSGSAAPTEQVTASRRLVRLAAADADAKLTITLLLPFANPAPARRRHAPAPKLPVQCSQTITAEDIASYLRQTKDTNPVHHRAQSVVPGLLLCHRAFPVLYHKPGGTFRIRVRFEQPLFAGETISYYQINQHEIAGFSGNCRICRMTLSNLEESNNAD